MRRSFLSLVMICAAASLLLAAAAPVARAQAKPAGGAMKKPENKPGGDVEQKNKLKLPADVDQKAINEAIDNGQAWLKKQQESGGTWDNFHIGPYGFGSPALLTLALVKSGMPRTDPAYQKAMKFIKEDYADKKGRGLLKTYAVGVLLMLLEAEPPKDRDPFRTEEVAKGEPWKADLAWVQECVDFLMRAHTGKRWTYGEAQVVHGGDEVDDNSNTQYALLGLAAANRMGVKPKEADRKKLLATVKDLLEQQQKQGPPVGKFGPAAGDVNADLRRTSDAPAPMARGWGYKRGGGWDTVTGSMTTACVASLVICNDLLTGPGPKFEPLDREYGQIHQQVRAAIFDGLGWVAKNFTVERNPNNGAWHYYYLYGLERAGVLTGQEYIGNHFWYGDGARYLLKCQIKTHDPDPNNNGKDMFGAWDSTRQNGKPGQNAEHIDPLEDTAFALLFLTRATVPPKVIPAPVITEGPGGALPPRPAPPVPANPPTPPQPAAPGKGK
ncbi:MAG: hypothetical protein HY719_09850 [Planctomycetes bacterium]|nr:hypothetical protein [Planctomycetota bacterium]